MEKLTKQAFYLAVQLVLLSLFFSCSYSDQRENSDQLLSAAYNLNTNPKESLELLRQINVGLLSEQEYAYYTLLHARACDLTGANIASLEESVHTAKERILMEYQPDKIVFAYFVMGRVFEAQNKQLKALHEYLQADSWAEKVNCQLSNFTYSQIPYNIANIYFYENNFSKSLLYTEKALADIEGKQYCYLEEVYALELKALSLHCLKDVHGALLYSDKAMAVACRHNDTTCKNRILYNKTVIFYDCNNSLVEKQCKQQLATCIQSNDTLHIGLLYLILAELYTNTSRIDSASIFAYKAKELVGSAEVWAQAYLYETLYSIESKNNNTSKSKIFKQELDRLVKEQEANRNTQQLELATIAERAKQQGEAASQVLQVVHHNRSSYKQLLIFVRVSLSMAAVALISWSIAIYIKRKQRLKDENSQCYGELLLYISQQRNIKTITRNLDCIGDSEYKVAIADTLSCLHTTLKMSPLFERSYGKLYDKLKEAFPECTFEELQVFWLAATRLLKEAEIRDYLNFTEDEFQRILASLTKKIRERRKSYRLGNFIIHDLSQSDDPQPPTPM